MASLSEGSGVFLSPEREFDAYDSESYASNSRLPVSVGGSSANISK